MRSDRCRSREGGLQAGKNRISRHAACLVWSAGGDAHRPLIGLAKYVNYLTLGELGDGYPLNHPKKAIFGALSRLNVLHELPPCQCGGQGPCEPWGVKTVVCPGNLPTVPPYDRPPQSILECLREFVGEQGVLPPSAATPYLCEARYICGIWEQPRRETGTALARCGTPLGRRWKLHGRQQPVIGSSEATQAPHARCRFVYPAQVAVRLQRSAPARRKDCSGVVACNVRPGHRSG